LRARDYDPVTGQFLTVDPAVDSTRQPYAYVGNNPVSRTDPSGLDWQDEVAAFGLGALDGATMGASSMLLSATVPGYDCFIQQHNTAFQVGSVVTQVVVAVVTIVGTAGAGTVLVAARYAAQLGVRVALKGSVAETRRLVVTAARRFADDTGSIGLRTADDAVKPLADDLILVRAGESTPARFANGSGVTASADGTLSGSRWAPGARWRRPARFSERTTWCFNS